MWWLPAAEPTGSHDRWFLLGWTICTKHLEDWHWTGNWSPPQGRDAADQLLLRWQIDRSVVQEINTSRPSLFDLGAIDQDWSCTTVITQSIFIRPQLSAALQSLSQRSVNKYMSTPPCYVYIHFPDLCCGFMRSGFKIFCTIKPTLLAKAEHSSNCQLRSYSGFFNVKIFWFLISSLSVHWISSGCG